MRPTFPARGQALGKFETQTLSGWKIFLLNLKLTISRVGSRTPKLSLNTGVAFSVGEE
jgi:hypothetical protein